MRRGDSNLAWKIVSAAAEALLADTDKPTSAQWVERAEDRPIKRKPSESAIRAEKVPQRIKELTNLRNRREQIEREPNNIRLFENLSKSYEVAERKFGLEGRGNAIKI